MNAALKVRDAWPLGRPARNDPPQRIVSKRDLRVVKWVVGNPPDTAKTLWEGTEYRLLKGDDAFAHVESLTGGRALPIVSAAVPGITEFQERCGEDWKPCPDPREGLRMLPSAAPPVNVHIIDADLAFWSPYRNFLEFPRWKRTLSCNLREAQGCFREVGLGSSDIVVVGYCAEEGANYDLVRKLRAESFAGRVYAFAEIFRHQEKFKRAGCNAVFSKNQMRRFISALYGC